jgi:hypothetical protein
VAAFWRGPRQYRHGSLSARLSSFRASMRFHVFLILNTDGVYLLPSRMGGVAQSTVLRVREGNVNCQRNNCFGVLARSNCKLLSQLPLDLTAGESRNSCYGHGALLKRLRAATEGTSMPDQACCQTNPKHLGRTNSFSNQLASGIESPS